MMNQPVLEGIRALGATDRVQVESLFTSERMYWLTASIATGFALMEVQDGDARARTDARANHMLEKFTEALRQGDISDDIFNASKAQALDNLGHLSQLMRYHAVFNPEWALGMCVGFISYWLFTKLIEVEWQRVLEREDERDSFIFLDGVIADQEELAHIREKVYRGEALFNDEAVYLRSHWEASADFFRRLESMLTLLDHGHIPFVTAHKQKK